MSYELHLIRVDAAEDALDAARRQSIRPLEKDLNPGPPVDSKEEDKQRLAACLLRFNGSLALARFDYAALAAAQKIDQAEARRRYRHLELNSEDYSGIQITLWDDAAELIFPYWHSGEQARAVLQQAWDYLELLQTLGAFVIYDPQLDRLLNLAADFQPVLSYLAAGSNATYESASSDM